jgi:hypothetical protein
MAHPRVHRQTPGDAYTQVAIVFHAGHWTGTQEAARASLSYDPVSGRLHWNARDRSGTTGEFKAVPFTVIAGLAAGDEELLSELRRATELAKTYARKRIKELQAEGSLASLRIARSLQADIKSDWLRTTPRTTSSARRRR